MKKIFIIIYLLSIQSMSLDSLAQSKHGVGLVEFDLLNSIGTPEANKLIPGLMAPYLQKLTKWKLEERVFFKKVLNEQLLQEALLDREEEAVEIGKIHGANKILTGSALRIGDERIINAKLIDVSSAELNRAATIRFKKDEALEDALEKLSWKMAGYSDRQIYTEWVDRALRKGSLGAALGTGWGHTRAEQWSRIESEDAVYDKGEEVNVSGMSIDGILHTYKWDLNLIGAVPNNVGYLGASVAYHPWTHFGVGTMGLWQNSTVQTGDDIERGTIDVKTAMGLISFRPSASFRFVFGKGLTMDGEIRYRSQGGFESFVPIQVKMDWLEGPTLAQIEYQFKDSKWFLIGRYFHDRIDSPILTYETADNRPAKRTVTLLERWAFLGVGANFALH